MEKNLKIEIELIIPEEKQNGIFMEEYKIVVNEKEVYNVRRPRMGNPNFMKSSQPPIDDLIDWCKLLG